MASELYLMEVGDGRYSTLLCDDRSITQMPALTPAETLIAFSELDYTDYRKAVRWLRNEHPLFEERIDIPVSDLEDFAAEAILLTPDLCEIDPVSGFVVTDILHQTLQAESAERGADWTVKGPPGGKPFLNARVHYSARKNSGFRSRRPSSAAAICASSAFRSPFSVPFSVR